MSSLLSTGVASRRAWNLQPHFLGETLILSVPGRVVVGELTCWGCAAPLNHVNTSREGAGAASQRAAGVIFADADE